MNGQAFIYFEFLAVINSKINKLRIKYTILRSMD